MAEFTKGFDLNTTDGKLTSARLNALMDDAMLVNVKQADLASGISLFENSEPGAPANGDNYVDANGVLNLRFGGAWVKGPLGGLDQRTITVTNSFATEIPANRVVAWKNTVDNEVTYAIDESDFRIAGVTAEAIPASSTGQMTIRGVCQVWMLFNGPGDGVPGAMFTGLSDGRGVVPTTPGASEGFAHIGYLLEDKSASIGNFTVWCYVWR